MAGEFRISEFIQSELSKRGLSQVEAVEAARWLDEAGLLRDSGTRPGLPLRSLLRAGKIQGQRQESNGRWFIDRIGAARSESFNPATVPARTRPAETLRSPDPELKARIVDGVNMSKRFDEARERYRPREIRYLLVAESPPKEESGRFFYFEDVYDGDSLFWETMKVLYPADCPMTGRPRHRKREFLDRFKRDGFYLLDAVAEPLGRMSAPAKCKRICESLPRLREDLRRWCSSRTKIVLISAPVYTVCSGPLKTEGFNVINVEMVDFPGSGCQRKFREKFSELLRQQGFFGDPL